MAGTPRIFEASEYPPEAGRVQLTLHIDVFSDRKGGCAVGFSAPEGSELVAKYGGKGRALAACRDVIVGDLDFLIREFYDEE
jgi:hypothetical protein